MSNRQITGHLMVTKVYKNGIKETIFDDSNVIVSGMGVGLSYLFAGSGSTTITDYQLDRFQLGVSGNPISLDPSTFELSGPLSSIAEYTDTSGSLSALAGKQVKTGVVSTSVFALIPFSQTTRVDESSVKFTITIDEDSANNILRDATAASLNEIGLLKKNPTGTITEDRSLLVAFRTFSNIVKTNDFSLIFDWTLNF